MATKIIKAQITLRRDTRSNWESVNPVLLEGELGIVSDDPNLYKVGDGRTEWNNLPYRGFDGTLVQEEGTSANAAMSQKAVTEALAKKPDTTGYYPSMQVGKADDLSGHGESVPVEFTFRATGGKSIKDGTAYIKEMQGNAVVWNQKVKGFASWNLQGGTIEGNEAVWSASDRTGALNAYSNTFAQHTTHKYLISADVKASSTNVGLGLYFMNFPLVKHTGSGNYESLAIITNGKGDGIDACYLTDTSTSGYGEIRAKNYRCIDLTKMFQAGNEPTTIEEYNARKPIVENEYAYNEGEVIAFNGDAIKSVGDNAWDEQWEQGGLDYGSGQEYDTTSYFRSKNYIKILPNTQYYFRKPAGVFLLPFYYDEDKNFIAADDVLFTNQAGNTFTTLNAAYMRFYCDRPTYGNDIMLTLVHSGWKVDTNAGYQPYWADTLQIDSRIKAAFTDENGVFKGLHKWDKVYNKDGKGYIVKGTGVVDLDSLGWYYDSYFEGYYSDSLQKAKTDFGGICSAYAFKGRYVDVQDKEMGVIYANSAFIKDSRHTDADSLIASLQGIHLYYELAEPEILEFDKPFKLDYKVADFGTEELISAEPSAPFKARTIYQFNAVDQIRENYNEIQQLKAMLTTLQAQLTSLTNNPE